MDCGAFVRVCYAMRRRLLGAARRSRPIWDFKDPGRRYLPMALAVAPVCSRPELREGDAMGTRRMKMVNAVHRMREIVG